MMSKHIDPPAKLLAAKAEAFGLFTNRDIITGIKRSSLYFLRISKASGNSTGVYSSPITKRQKRVNAARTCGFVAITVGVLKKLPERSQHKTVRAENMPMIDVESGIKKQVIAVQ